MSERPYGMSERFIVISYVDNLGIGEILGVFKHKELAETFKNSFLKHRYLHIKSVMWEGME